MKIVLMWVTILGFIIIGCLGLGWAEDTCKEWQTTEAKIPGDKVKLSLSTTKEGQKLMQWSPHTDFYSLFIFKAKGPANAKGEIERCNVGKNVNTFKNENSISLRELRETQKLQPGYYAIRVIIWSDEYDPTTMTQKKGDTSNWITIKIE